MTISECYDAIDGDLKDVTARLMGEARVRKFALRFLNDDSFELLRSSLEAGNYTEAFRAAHTLKGVCQNLSFNKLYASAFQITEALRDGKPLADMTLFDAVASDYELTVSALRQVEQ